jgi:hypothetical protein
MPCFDYSLFGDTVRSSLALVFMVPVIFTRKRVNEVRSRCRKLCRGVAL